MAKPTISLMGATYPDVSGVELPTSGGGTASFPFVEGSQTVTVNGTYDVTALASLIVNVSGGGGSGLEYETGEFTTSTSIARPTISFAKTHQKPPAIITMSDMTTETAPESNSMQFWVFADILQLFGGWSISSGTALVCGRIAYTYRSGTSFASGNSAPQYDYTDIAREDASSSTRYYARESAFYPRGSSSKYWMPNRTYKWIAVWI